MHTFRSGKLELPIKTHLTQSMHVPLGYLTGVKLGSWDGTLAAEKGTLEIAMVPSPWFQNHFSPNNHGFYGRLLKQIAQF